MSTSRYSARAHQRERQSLFSMDDLSKSPSPMINSYDNNNNNNIINNNINFNMNSTSENNNPNIPTSISVSSPYEDENEKYKYNKTSYSVTAQNMAQLESQSDETVSIMKNKIGALRDLSLAMGTEINKSKKNLTELGEDMGLSRDKIQNNMNRMRRFVEKSGISWKVWLVFATIIIWCFLWVWLF